MGVFLFCIQFVSLKEELQTMIKVAFIVNGNRKVNKLNEEIIQMALDHPNLDVTIEKTSYAQEAIQLAKNCCDNKNEIIVAVGGDGTINEVVNGIMLSEIKPILALLPNGTGNDFYRNFKKTSSKETMIAAFLAKKSFPIDTIKATFNEQVKYCCNIADVGLGGKVISILEQQRQLFGGKISYNIAIIRGFLAYKKKQMVVQFNEKTLKSNMLLVAICNGKFFAHGLTINPYTSINDGYIHITSFQKVSLVDYIRELPKLKKGTPIVHPEVNYFKTKKVSIQSENSFGEMDGEGFTSSNITFEIQEKSLSLLML